MKIVVKNKRKFKTRIYELITIILAIIITPISIKYATTTRGYMAVGSEYLLPVWALIIIHIIETIYKERGE